MVQVGEAAFDQRANEIQRQGRALIAAQQELRIGRARLRRELGAVDDVAPVGGQPHIAARLVVLGARFGILAGEPADARHRSFRAHHQHQAHLQKDLQRVGDAGGSAAVETLGAIAAFQDETAPGGGLRQLLPQVEDLPARHQGRQPPQFVERPLQRGGVGVLRLLQDGALAPGIRRPFRNHEFSS